LLFLTTPLWRNIPIVAIIYRFFTSHNRYIFKNKRIGKEGDFSYGREMELMTGQLLWGLTPVIM
jgi:hypothetical protein